jgi:P4 family phage/plasmid primase-like protien
MADFIQNLYYTYASEIAQGDMGNKYIYCLQEDKIYFYDKGLWKEIFEKEFIYKMNKFKPQITALTPTCKNQIIEHFKVLKHLRLEEFNKSNLINFINYMYDPLGNNILEHKPEQYSTIRIPYKYDALARCELWLKTLNEIFENNQSKIDSLQEYFGYCLTKDTIQIMSLLLQGESKSGKSTILYVLRHLIGDENCSSVEMVNISNPQYTPMLINKLVNIDADVSEHSKDFEAQFKKITSGEPINCNQKFVKTFPFLPYCKIVIAANKFPRITDQSSAFYNRLLIIPCNRIFLPLEQDRKLKFKLLEELPGIFNWSVKGLHKLNQRGMFEDKEFIREAVEELREESNPVEAFFKEHIEIDVSGNEYIIKEDLYQKYIEWCIKNGHGKMGNNRFGHMVYQKYSKYTPKNTMVHGIMKRVWKNIKYVHFKDDTKQDISWEPAVAVDKTPSPTTIGADSQQVQSDINWEE